MRAAGVLTFSVLAPLLWLGGACKPEQGISRVTQSDVFLQQPTNEVDILWVVDNSLSMGNEQDELIARFKEFIASMEETGLDWHIGVVTTDLEDSDKRGVLMGDPTIVTSATEEYETVFKQLIKKVGINGSDKEAGIDAAYIALSEPLVSTTNAGFLRDEARLSIIYVSDENDCTDRGALDGESGKACYDDYDQLVPMVDLIEDYHSLKTDDTRILVSSIVGPRDPTACPGASPGFRYLTMAEAFGGISGSICDESFSDIMSNLGLQSSGRFTSFQLSYAPVLDTLHVYVDEVEVLEDETDGWTFDETYQMLTFHGTSVPDFGSVITVNYEVLGDRTELDTGSR